MVAEKKQTKEKKDWKNSVECAIIKKEKRKVVGQVQPRRRKKNDWHLSNNE